MKKLIFLAGLIFLAQLSQGQEPKDHRSEPYIEITGHAEKKVVPDEIYISITIKERESGRNKVSVEQQESDLRAALQKLNIPHENLTVSDAQADYIKVKWTKKDVISRSGYELKLSTAQQVADVFEQLDELKIDNAYIARVSHSKIKAFTREVDIEAIKAARSKADYLLAAIGQETGPALIVRESNAQEGVRYSNGMQVHGAKAASNFMYEPPPKDKLGTIAFRKIKLETTIYVKFAIK